MTLAVDKINGHGLSNIACCECLPKKTKVHDVVLATEDVLMPNSSNKMEHFSYKGEWVQV